VPDEKILQRIGEAVDRMITVDVSGRGLIQPLYDGAQAWKISRWHWLLDADLHRLADRLIKRHGDCRSVFLIVVEHNENEDRYAETNKKNSRHGAQLGRPQPRQ
jgi:hypothetical protein